MGVGQGKGQDVDLQLTDLRTYAAARGWEIVKEYVDNGQSGAKEQRPALIELMNDARKRKIDVILVWRLDRFGRSLRHLINALHELKTLGVGFYSFKESLDFTTASGRLLFHLLASFAEFERELIRERVKAGVANARKKGKKLGRPPLGQCGAFGKDGGYEGQGDELWSYWEGFRTTQGGRLQIPSKFHPKNPMISRPGQVKNPVY